MGYNEDHVFIRARIEKKGLQDINLAIRHDFLMKRIAGETLSEWLRWLIKRRIEEIRKGG